MYIISTVRNSPKPNTGTNLSPAQIIEPRCEEHAEATLNKWLDVNLCHRLLAVLQHIPTDVELEQDNHPESIIKQRIKEVFNRSMNWSPGTKILVDINTNNTLTLTSLGANDDSTILEQLALSGKIADDTAQTNPRRNLSITVPQDQLETLNLHRDQNTGSMLKALVINILADKSLTATKAATTIQALFRGIQSRKGMRILDFINLFATSRPPAAPTPETSTPAAPQAATTPEASPQTAPIAEPNSTAALQANVIRNQSEGKKTVKKTSSVQRFSLFSLLASAAWSTYCTVIGQASYLYSSIAHCYASASKSHRRSYRKLHLFPADKQPPTSYKV